MPTYTPIYNLALYNSTTDGGQTFASYRAALSGVSDSNMIKIENGMLALQLAMAKVPFGYAYINAADGGTNAYAVEGITTMESYVIGRGILLVVDSDNTGSSTLAINSLGVRSLKKSDGTGLPIELSANDLIAGKMYIFIYTSDSEWVMITAKADVPSASTSQQGIVELSTSAETTAGTSSNLAVTPNSLAQSDYGTRIVQIQVTDPNGDVLAVADGQAYFRVPAYINGYNLVSVAGHVTTVSTSGTPTIQIHNVTDGQDMLSTPITIDANEKDSSTATTPPVINTSYDDVATADELRIDIDGAGTGTKGLIVEMAFRLP